MEIEIFNPYVIKIIISARKEDSINSISKRINLSYGWTYKWIKKLIKIGVFTTKNSKLILNNNNKFYKNTLNYIKKNFKETIPFYYNVLGLFGIKYCFTKTDAVFIWTKGGYNISRYKKFYPIFIKIKKDDFNLFKYYCKKLDLKINKNKNIFYKVELLKDFKCKLLNKIPVDSLNETIKFMKKYKYNFQPALEMIKELYHKKIKVKYKEVKNVWTINPKRKEYPRDLTDIS